MKIEPNTYFCDIQKMWNPSADGWAQRKLHSTANWILSSKVIAGRSIAGHVPIKIGIDGEQLFVKAENVDCWILKAQEI